MTCRAAYPLSGHEVRRKCGVPYTMHFGANRHPAWEDVVQADSTRIGLCHVLPCWDYLSGRGGPVQHQPGEAYPLAMPSHTLKSSFPISSTELCLILQLELKMPSSTAGRMRTRAVFA